MNVRTRTFRLVDFPTLSIDSADAERAFGAPVGALSSPQECPLFAQYCTRGNSQRFVINRDGTVSPLKRRDLVWGFSQSSGGEEVVLVSALDAERRLELDLPSDFDGMDETVWRYEVQPLAPAGLGNIG